MAKSTIINIKHAPPTTNTLYANAAKGGRVKSQRYRTWKVAAGWDIRQAKWSKVNGPVLLDLTVKRTNSRSDISNRIKAMEDLLVDMEVIDDDRNVMEVRARWGDVEGCRVKITPIAAKK